MTSIIKVDNLQNQCGANIISESANVITIGASGDTVTLAAGASQSGFGRSGSVNWDTTKKTTGFTSVSGNGYFCDTTSSAFTVTLPATPSAGDIVAIADYANTSATNNITVGRNGSLIDGSAIDAKIKINGQVYTLVYVDATEGWKTVSQTFNQISTAEFITATGGTITTSGDYKIHTFTGPGTFTVCSVGNPAGSTTVDYMVVAGGGGGGGTDCTSSGGGGAGGFRESVPSPAAWTASPLASPGGALPVSVQGYPITVGGGGGGGTSAAVSLGTPGSNSIFSTITSAGGGGGRGYPPGGVNLNGASGGSGGGASYSGTGGAGNTPPTSPSQGNSGGNGGVSPQGGGGGGGATASGTNGNASPTSAGPGGAGAGTAINPSPSVGTPGPSGPLRYFAGGGGGGMNIGCAPGTIAGTGGVGGGADGKKNTAPSNNGTTNTGGGGGGIGSSGGSVAGGTGGSGIVVIRYKFQ
jgi:hypothetical protein